LLQHVPVAQFALTEHVAGGGGVGVGGGKQAAHPPLKQHSPGAHPPASGAAPASAAAALHVPLKACCAHCPKPGEEPGLG
jgi:hypothetical protein